MNGIQRRKAQNEKQFPGCLGRMVNVFDLGNGVTGNRQLTDKPHNDGSSLPRSCLDVSSMQTARFGDQFGDKMIVSELRRCSSNKKANGTPMKTLIAQEMSKEVDSRHNPPNVVAKLMGLDTLPHQQHNSAPERSHSKGNSRRSLSQPEIILECWQQDHSILEKQMQCQEQNEYRDVYEIWHQSEKANIRDVSSQMGRHNEGRTNENATGKKMALVRQKFIEAKRLAMDEKSRQSREFQDALEVLSSNRDLFLKFLQEPNSMFSQHLYNVQSIPPPLETKRITVLRPSKAIDNEKFAVSGKKDDKLSKRPTQIGQATVWDKKNSGCSPAFPNQRFEQYTAQPTRIVVLKPSPGKTHDMKALVMPPTSSPRILQGEEFYDGPEDEEAQESREVAKEITEQMHESIMGCGRDETLLSSVFSNGYIGDDSSFNKSENDYAVGNLSDSEIMSPTSRHSWDYINRFGSPYSFSSFSRASCSPESSVCREAKKRLSERWAMMASNGSSQEQKTQGSSSTLGEMLALSNTKKSVRSEEETTNNEKEPRGSTSCTTSNLNKDKGMADSPKPLLRSRSVPVSSTVYDTGFNIGVSESEAGETEIFKDLKTAKSTKLSLKGKVSSLFFSRNKKSNKEKSGVSQSKDEYQPPTPETPGLPIPLPGTIGDDTSQCAKSSDLEDCCSPGLHRPSSKTSPNLIVVAENQGFVFQEGVQLVEKPVMPGNTSENQDQPSPISVLEPPFEEDDNTVPEPSGNIRPNYRGAEVPLKCNLIDKSPPIGSIARTLSWDDSRVETATPHSLKPSSTCSCPEEEEQDWPFLIKTLLSEAGVDGNMQLDLLFARWHSPESPLDPTLRYKYANLNDKEILHEAKRRQRRSNRKLVFDCVNAALMEISGYGSDRSARAMPCTGAHNRLIQGTSAMLVDYVWAQMKEWFCSEVRCTFEETGDSSSLVVERVVRKEVVGKGWTDNMRVELDNMGKEIENKLLAELVEDAVVDLTSCV